MDSASSLTLQSSISFNKNGISKPVELAYSSHFKLFEGSKKVTARFRRKDNLIAVDYKFIDSNRWFKGFEANEKLAHYLILKDNELVIKTLIDFWKISFIKL